MEEEVVNLENPCSSEEILEVLKGFSKDKSPGPDGWTVEFFLHFYELVGKDLLDVVEETRLRGEVIRSINSTFIALIPKVNNPTPLAISAQLLCVIYVTRSLQKL
jgi:hypothetical protein